MSIQPSQVASIDLSGKPEGATHYSVNRPDARVDNWYKLESGKWKFWALARWATTAGMAPIKEVFEIPVQPDWSKGPADATHWGPAAASGQESCISYAECFYRFSEGDSMVATDMLDWEWRKVTRDVTPERRAMLIRRPQAIDWSAAPGWAIGHGLIGDDPLPSWIGKTQYLYVGSKAGAYKFASDASHPLYFSRSEVADYVERPFVPFDFSGSVIAHGLPLIVKPWEGDLPPAGHPVDYLGHDGEWTDGTYVGSYLGQAVVACRESGVVGFLDYAAGEMVWERPQWNGEGRPPVGVTCGLRYKGVDQGEATVLFMSAETGVFANSTFGHEQCGDLALYDFYPICTPEQIAADERLHKIRNAATDIASTLEACSKTVAYKDIAATVLEAMIDAGYAKPVKA